MAEGNIGEFVCHLRQLLDPGQGSGVSDAELLARFARTGEQEAFELLVWRHRQLVLSVCRRVLGDFHEAEDAFQATFLLLARKASSIARGEALASWLYRVAYRVALEAHARRSKRAKHERNDLDLTSFPSLAEPAHAIERRDLWAAMDEEVNRLPRKLRVPVVLCYLEGKTYAEAGRQLGLPVGTVSDRLTRARSLLQSRLSRRGLGLSGALLATVLCEQAAKAAVPAGLVNAAVKFAILAAGRTAVAGAIPPKIASLTKGVLQTMLFTKLKIVVIAASAVLVVCWGGGFLAYRALAARQAEAPEAAPTSATAHSSATDTQSEWVEKMALKVPGQGIRSVTITHFGGLVVAGTHKGEIRRWNSRGEEGPAVKVGESMVSSVALGPTNQALLAFATARQARIWDQREREPKVVLADHSRAVNAVAFSPDTTTLASGGADGVVKLSDIKTHKERATLAWPVKPHDGGQIVSIAFSPDGRTVAAGGLGINADGVVQLWDTASYMEVETLTYPGQPVMAVAYSPDGGTLAVGAGVTVHLCHAGQAKERAAFSVLRERRITAHISSLAFTPDCKTLAVGWETVKLYDLATLNEQAEVNIPGSREHHVAFDASGKTLVAGGTVTGKQGGGIVKVWELREKRAEKK
jgi:RNA polymerase sigma factor (sigma-70 family)